MASCPFCGGDISDDLERFGGACPHCFAHIPGEDAATDPGEEVKAQQKAEDSKRRRRQQTIPVVLAGMATFVVLIGVYLNLREEPMAEPLAFDSSEMAFEIEIAALDTDAAYAQRLAEREAEEKAAAEARRLASRRTKAKASGAKDPEGQASAPEVSEAPTLGERRAAVDDKGLVLQARRRGPVLSARGDIKAAFEDVFRSRAGRLEICLQKTRKVAPDLEGSWVFSVVVDKAGAFTEVDVRGRDTQHAAFERCLQREVEGWRLAGELEKPWPVSFPINFNL